MGADINYPKDYDEFLQRQNQRKGTIDFRAWLSIERENYA